jgi:hypothetical protein
MKVELSYEIHFEIKSSKELLLLFKNFPRWDGLVSYLVRDNPRVEREDVLVLGGKIHRSHSDAMHIFVLESLAKLTYFCDVLIKDLCR